MYVKNGVVVGNVYNKYEAKNPIVRYLTNNFINQLTKLVINTNASDVHEVGCGEGYLSSLLFDLLGKRIKASDYSAEIIELARQIHKDKDITFKACSIYNLNQKDDSAELVICCETLEHLKEPHLALSILQKLATHYAIISVPREPLWRILNVLRGKYVSNRGNTPGHVQHWSKRSFLNMVRNYFHICEVKTPLPWTMVLCRTK